MVRRGPQTHRRPKARYALKFAAFGSCVIGCETGCRIPCWLRFWLSEAVAIYLGQPGGTALHGSYPSETRAGLRVYVAKPDYLLAMKLRAMRIASRDENDAALLAHATDITTFDAMAALLDRYFPNEPPDARRVAIIRQFAETLNARSSDDAG